MRQLRLIAIVSSLLILNACAPYYVKHKRFMSFIEQEQFKQAETELATSKQAKKKRMRLLYLLERGYVDLSLGNFKESADYFEEADYLIEDYRRSLGYEALAIITNPGVKPYKAEDFEIVMLHYFNAVNYLKMRNFEDALVECRRMNLSLIAMAERPPAFGMKLKSFDAAETLKMPGIPIMESGLKTLGSKKVSSMRR
jgi:hypothetical protein